MSHAIQAGVSALREQMGSGASELVHRAKEEGQRYIADRKSTVAGELANVSGAIRRAADKLHDQHSDRVAGYVDHAAERVKQAAQYLEKRDVNELADDVSQMARRYPALFLGGVFVAGLAAARFVKAASETSPTRRRQS